MFICVEYRRVWASKPIRYQIFKHHKLCVKLKQIYVSCGELSAIKFIQQKCIIIQNVVLRHLRMKIGGMYYAKTTETTMKQLLITYAAN